VDKHGAKILRGTQNTAEQSVILLIFKDFQKSGRRSVENRKEAGADSNLCYHLSLASFASDTIFYPCFII
jgi:hypothetical protein